MGNKGSNTTTTQQSGSTMADPNAYAQYLSLLNRAGSVAGAPYVGYNGEETAPINAQQTEGIGNLNTAAGNVTAAGAPLTADDVQKWENPYTSDVINATQADFDTQNQRANSTVLGNAASQGALGGDRAGVAQALTQESQNRVQAPIIAGLRQSGYNQAVGTAQQQQGFGLTAAQAQEGAAGQQIGAGTLQQQTQQTADTQGRQDYYQAMGYPFQVAQWLASIDTGVGGAMGSTSTGNAQTQGPQPNTLAQIAGLGIAGASLFVNRGGRVAGFADGGAPGMIEAGNIDLHHRPRVKNPDGSISTVRSEGINEGGQEVLIPTVRANPFRPNTGWIMSDDAARQRYLNTGEHLGKFDTPENSDAYAQQLHEDQAQEYLGHRYGGRVAGFAAGGTPYGDSQTWVPTPQLHATALHAQLPSAPQAAKPQGLSSDQLKGIGVLGKGIGNSSFGDHMQDYFQDMGTENANPIGDYTGLGAYRGGRIKRYASAGAVSGDDSTFDDRFDASFPHMTAGLGASSAAFDDRFPHEDDRFDVATPKQERAFVTAGRRMQGAVNPEPGDEIRLDPSADTAWSNRVDQENGPPSQMASRVGIPDNDNAAAAISRQIAPRSGVAPAEEEPSTALGLAGPPRTAGVAPQTPQTPSAEQEQPKGLLQSLGINVTPELKQGLLQAGLAMMATTRGGPGSFLGAAGEAGMAGVGAYSKSLEATQKQQQQDLENHLKIKQEEERAANMGLVRGPDGSFVPNKALLEMEKQKAEINQKDNWQLVPGDGITLPDRLFNKATGEFKEVAPGKGQEALNTIQNGQFNYVAGGPRVEKGDSLPEPKPIPGYSAQAIKDDAAYYIATGNLPKASVSPRNPMGMQSVAYQRLIRNYGAALLASKGMSEDDFADLRRFGPQAARFPLSRQGDQTVAIGTAIRHIGALEEYAKAWDASKGNQNAPIVRQAAARFAKFLGKAEPTNLEEAASIAGPEIIKAIGVAGGGTGGERVAQEAGFRPGAHTDQILGAANVAKTFLAGQLPAKEAQAAAVHFPHEKFMSMVGPTEYDYLSAINHGKNPETAMSGKEGAKGPAVGDVVKGWKFKGGDPSKKESWEKP